MDTAMRFTSTYVRTSALLLVAGAVAALIASCGSPKWREFNSLMTVDSIIRSPEYHAQSGRATLVVYFKDLCDDQPTQGMLLKVFVNKRFSSRIRTTKSTESIDITVDGDTVSVSADALYRWYGSAWSEGVHVLPGDTVFMTFHSGGVCSGYERFRRFPH